MCKKKERRKDVDKKIKETKMIQQQINKRNLNKQKKKVFYITVTTVDAATNVAIVTSVTTVTTFFVHFFVQNFFL